MAPTTLSITVNLHCSQEQLSLGVLIFKDLASLRTLSQLAFQSFRRSITLSNAEFEGSMEADGVA